MSGAAYRDRGFGGAAEMDRKRIKDALEKHTERPSPSTSRGVSREKELLAAGKITTTIGKVPKVSDGEEFETDSEDSDVSGSEGEDTSWISWFCSLRGNEFFCEIDDDYIQDDFNLCGLSNQVPYYDYALDLILDIESSNGDVFTEEQNELIESSAEMLYGLIHARYILTSKGLAAMLEKFKNYDFGRCPRVYCCGQPCLPAGQSDIPRSSTVKVFCPKCEDLHYPRSKYQGNIDGAYFGTTFPHLFLMTYPHLNEISRGDLLATIGDWDRCARIWNICWTSRISRRREPPGGIAFSQEVVTFGKFRCFHLHSGDIAIPMDLGLAQPDQLD